MPVAYALLYGTMVLDPLGTLLAILIGGWMSAMLAQALRIPRIVGMIFFGMAFYPAASDVIVGVQTAVNPNGGGQLLPGVPWPSGSAGCVSQGGNIVNGISTTCASYSTTALVLSSPATIIRTVALLIALARGSFGLSLDALRARPLTILLLSIVPYAAEMLIEAAVAPAILPVASGLTPAAAFPVMGMMPFVASSLWAALSPSLVIPNMLALVETRGPVGPAPAGGESPVAAAARRKRIADSVTNVILVAAPLEVATALITYGSLLVAATSVTSGSADVTNAPGLIVVWVFAAIALGVLVSLALRTWRSIRALPWFVKTYGAPVPGEQMLTFVSAYFFCYVVCQDAYIPKLNNFVCALAMVLSARVLCPGLADAVVIPLKFVWLIIEVLLFVLTGFVIRNGIDSNNAAVSGQFFAVLVIGTFGRLVSDFFVAIIWQLNSEAALRAEAAGASPGGARCWNVRALNWRMVVYRAAFSWAVTSPKATVQAAVGGDVSKHNVQFGLVSTVNGVTTTSPVGAFIQVSCALSILYCATAGSILTWTLGVFLLTKVFNLRDPAGVPLPPEVLALIGIDPKLGYHVTTEQAMMADVAAAGAAAACTPVAPPGIAAPQAVPTAAAHNSAPSQTTPALWRALAEETSPPNQLGLGNNRSASFYFTVRPPTKAFSSHTRLYSH